MQTAGALLFNDMTNGRIFDTAQLLCGDLALRKLLAGIFDSIRSQEAADYVCAERGLMSLHGYSPRTPEQMITRRDNS
jgi:hypothetical protein